MASNKGLGRGLGALLGDFTEEPQDSKNPYRTLPIYKVEPNPGQPRQDFDEEELQALADSIATHGIVQPLTVREISGGYYQIIAGERRWRAARQAGLKEVPAVIIEADDKKTMELALIENLQRQDLNPVEEAFAYKALIDRFSMTQEEVARQVGKNRSTIANMLRLLELPDEVLKLLRDGKLSMGHARALLGLDDADEMVRLGERIVEKEYSVRDVERIVRLMTSNHASDEEDDDPETTQKKVYMKDLETRVMTRLGRRVRIHQSARKKTVEVSYEDDKDLEDLLKTLAGQDVFD